MVTSRRVSHGVIHVYECTTEIYYMNTTRINSFVCLSKKLFLGAIVVAFNWILPQLFTKMVAVCDNLLENIYSTSTSHM